MVGPHSTSPGHRNVIVILNDSLRRDHIAAYGDPAPWERPGHEDEPFIQTPALDKLARESAIFDRFYVSSYPTVPCRADLFAGIWTFPNRGWQPLEQEDVVLAEILRQHGVLSSYIYDTPMLSYADYNFNRGFHSWQFIRGQHSDRFATAPIKVPLPAPPRLLKDIGSTELYLRNSAHRRFERDWMVAQTANVAMDWLEENYQQPGFVLWVDMWDPHEPFDAPAFDMARYGDPTYDGPETIYPRYGRAGFFEPDELNFVRGSYAALVTLVDRWVGKVLDKVDTLGLRENTMIVYLTDHGHLFGDHGLEGKPTGPLGSLWEQLVRIPVMIRHPEGVGAGTRAQGIAQHPDILPTILEFLDIPAPSTVQGTSLLPALANPDVPIREIAFSGRYSALLDTHRRTDAKAFDGWAGLQAGLEPLTATTDEWSLICHSAPRPIELYHLAEDPVQERNLAAAKPDQVEAMRAPLLDFLSQTGSDPRRVDAYRSTDRSVHAVSGGPASNLPQRSTVFYTITDRHGKLFAFPTEKEATICLTPDLPAQQITPMTLADLLADHPQALIHYDQQYYWPSDLAGNVGI